MHRLIRSTTAGGPVRHGDGARGRRQAKSGPPANAERNSHERKWPAELSEMPEGSRKAQKSRLLRGRFRTGPNCPKLSEFIRLSGPPPNRPQINPSKPL